MSSDERLLKNMDDLMRSVSDIKTTTMLVEERQKAGNEKIDYLSKEFHDFKAASDDREAEIKEEIHNLRLDITENYMKTSTWEEKWKPWRAAFIVAVIGLVIQYGQDFMRTTNEVQHIKATIKEAKKDDQ